MHNSYLTAYSVECYPAAFHGREVLTRFGNSSASAHCISAWVANSSFRLSEMPFSGTAVVENKDNVALQYPVQTLQSKELIWQTFSPLAQKKTPHLPPPMIQTLQTSNLALPNHKSVNTLAALSCKCQQHDLLGSKALPK